VGASRFACLCRLAVVVGLIALLGGCIPMLPVPSKLGPEPYPAATLEFLTPGVTMRAEIVAKFGEPHISRGAGAVLVYGGARDAGKGRIVIFTPPFWIPVSLPEEEFFVLVIEMNADDTLGRYEIVRHEQGGGGIKHMNMPCTTTGICVMDVDWSTAGVPIVWMRDDKIKHGERALLTAPTAAEEHARSMVAPTTGCSVYFTVRFRERTYYRDYLLGDLWGTGGIYFGLDEGAALLYDDKLFSLWQLPAGRHVFHARRKDGTEVASQAIDCRDGSIAAIEGVVIPALVGQRVSAVFATLDLDAARSAIATRRLMLLD
jgi:hypothetical protein